MRVGSKFRILVVGIIAATACLVAAGAGIADTTNNDPAGDAKGGAPDITQVVTAVTTPTSVTLVPVAVRPRTIGIESLARESGLHPDSCFGS